MLIAWWGWLMVCPVVLSKSSPIWWWFGCAKAGLGHLDHWHCFGIALWAQNYRSPKWMIGITQHDQICSDCSLFGNIILRNLIYRNRMYICILLYYFYIVYIFIFILILIFIFIFILQYAIKTHIYICIYIYIYIYMYTYTADLWLSFVFRRGEEINPSSTLGKRQMGQRNVLASKMGIGWWASVPCFSKSRYAKRSWLYP